MTLKDEGHFLAGECPVLLGESEAAVELWVVAESFVESGHADQDEGDVGAIVPVAQQFQRGGVSRSASSMMTISARSARVPVCTMGLVA